MMLGDRLSGRILDACAAPGGKTMVLAELADGAELVAVDRNGNRSQRAVRVVQVTANRPPKVRILTPTSGSSRVRARPPALPPSTV